MFVHGHILGMYSSWSVFVIQQGMRYMHITVAAFALALLPAGKGALTYLQWNDMTCNNCGGKADARCIQVTTGTDAQHSCGSKYWAHSLTS